MNRTDLIDKVVQRTQLKRADAVAALNAILDSLSEALKTGDRVSLVGFGSFDLGYRPSRKGINPSNQQSIEIADKVSVKFKAGKELADSVDNADLKAKFIAKKAPKTTPAPVEAPPAKAAKTSKAKAETTKKEPAAPKKSSTKKKD